jgi:hypothetical protein
MSREIDMEILVAVARDRLGIGDKALADMAGALPDVGVNVDDHYSTPYLRQTSRRKVPFSRRGCDSLSRLFR